MNAKTVRKRTARPRATGAIAINFHEGSRSEILADYLFTGWGTVTPVRRQDDHGVDLSCTFVERVGRLARVSEYYSVQVKSDTSPWAFNDPESVRWLLQHPTPLFLCTVDKTAGLIRVYHAMPRFCVAAMGRLPSRLELQPETGHGGSFVNWTDGTKFSLSAPIFEAGLRDLTDSDRMRELGDVLYGWIKYERDNCDLLRQGLLRFRMPTPYTTNRPPNQGIGEMGLAEPVDRRLIKRGIARLAEALECIGGQLAQTGDRDIALHAELLLAKLRRKRPEAFADDPRLRLGVNGLLGTTVNRGLNAAHGPTADLFAGRDALEAAIADLPLVKRYLTSS